MLQTLSNNYLMSIFSLQNLKFHANLYKMADKMVAEYVYVVMSKCDRM